MPKTKLLLPKFLTNRICEDAIRVAATAAMTPFALRAALKRETFHVVVLVPAIEDDRATDYENWPNYPTKPFCLADVSYGDKARWSRDFRSIAQCKAQQLWYDRNDGGTDIMPHLLFSGDTPFCGGVKRDGIVVACSGVQPWFDRMIAGMVADICIARAYDAWMMSDDKADDELCFLT